MEDSSNSTVKLAAMVDEARDSIHDLIPLKTTTRESAGLGGGKRFTRKFQQFLDEPGLFMEVLRERRFSRKHWDGHVKRGRTDVRTGKDMRGMQVAWVECGCVERLGYRVVKRVVIERVNVVDVGVELLMSTKLVKQVLESELKTIARAVEGRKR